MSRLEWILGILLVLLLLAVVGLSALFWLRPARISPADASATANAVRAGEIAPTSVYEGQTAMFAYNEAHQQVTGWRSDAVLLNVVATWPQGAALADLKSGRATWGYTFYSPESGATALVTVDDQEAKLFSEGTYSAPGPIGNLDGWTLDSQDAIDLFLQEGGAAFIDEAGVTTLIMRLTTDNINGRLEWFLSLFSGRDGRSFDMQIDANSGEILTVTNVP